MLQKIAIVFSFCFFLVSTAIAAEPSGIDPIQGATQLARPEILRQITSQVEAIQKESPGIEFKLFLVPADVKADFKEIRNKAFSNYVKVDPSLQTVFLFYRLGEQDYQFVLHPDLKDIVSPVYLCHIADTYLVPQLKSKQYEGAFLSTVPRISAYLGLVNRLKPRQSQQDMVSGKVPPERVEYKKPIFEEFPSGDANTPKQKPGTNGALYLVGSLAFLGVMGAGAYWWYRKKKKEEDAELEEDDYEE